MRGGYDIADYYPEPNNPATAIGIVVYVNPANRLHGMIVSLDEATSLTWGPNTVLTGANDKNNGAANMATIKAIINWATTYPAFAWCDAKNSSAPQGVKWYLPAKQELRIINAAMGGLSWIPSGIANIGEVVDWGDNKTMPNANADEVVAARSAFKAKITAAGGAATFGGTTAHWSSTETTAASNAYYCKFDGYPEVSAGKTIGRYVRAISAF